MTDPTSSTVKQNTLSSFQLPIFKECLPGCRRATRYGGRLVKTERLWLERESSHRSSGILGVCALCALAKHRLSDLPGGHPRANLLDDAARLEGCSLLGRLWRVYVPLAKPTYIAYGLVLVSYHWNNFLWPLVITNSVTTRPLTVGLAVFATTDQGIDWSVVTAATLMTSMPLLVAFLLFQRQFVQSFMRAGIR